MLHRTMRLLDLAIYLLLGVILLSASDPLPGDQGEQARAYTRTLEFDYTSWSAEAALLKIQSAAVGLPYYLPPASRKQAVMEYMRLTERILQGEDQLNRIYADPDITDKESASAHLRAELNRLYQRQEDLTPIAESALQEQVTQALAELDLTGGGQPIPPVLYHSSPVPMALIISPRQTIQQITNISLQPDLPIDQQAALEGQVDKALDVSSLVVPVGGIGVYPTMVMRTTNLPWILNTVAHEWTHNFLTLRPLGYLYNATPELRTMNETAASIVGNEVGALALARYYPELAHASFPDFQPASLQWALPRLAVNAPLAFEFRAEMRETRVTTDALLAAGKIEEAQAYMEARRQVFWDNGYALRKLNQAYFAFYGAYADEPGGAAGEDPVGPAVRALRAQSASLAEFLNRISWMVSFEQLQKAIAP